MMELSSMHMVQKMLMAVAVALLAIITLVPAIASAAPPKSKEEFDKMFVEAGKTPEGSLKMWFEGVYYYGNGQEKLGHYIISQTTVRLDKSPDWHKKSSTYTFAQRLHSKKYIFRSYAEGAITSTDYKMDSENFKLNILFSGKDPYDRGHVIKLQSAGADNPRPVYLLQSKKTGLWKVHTFSAIYSDIKKYTEDDEF